MITINRVFVLILIAFAGVWIWADVRAQQERTAAKAFYEQQVAPQFEASKRESEAFNQAMRERQAGKQVPLPQMTMVNTAPMDEWMEHMKRWSHYIFIRMNAQFGFMGAIFVWGIAAQIQAAIRRRRQEAPERPAVPDAGKLIGGLVTSGSVFVAKAGDRATSPKVEVDGARAVVIFYHLTFVTAFVGNTRRDRTEVPFTDIIAGACYSNRDGAWLNLRTTQGKVMITGNIHPFQELVNLLLDAAELNRTAPDQYHAALAREPHVRTPWYGWLIIAAAVASVVGAFWWNYSH
jgi:hypothetical protein